MKILCLGNNTKDTDDQTAVLALANNMKSFGLISDLETTYDLSQPLSDGYYHSSIYDFPQRLPELILLFDKVILLDQPIDQWTHLNAYTDTIRVLTNVSNVVYLNKKNISTHGYWTSLLKNNPSFCIYPFIGIILNRHNTHTVVCCRSEINVNEMHNGVDFKTGYDEIRNRLINGIQIPNCQFCYDLENKDIDSPRKYETIEWVNRLKVQSLSDIKQHIIPVYYEIRADNKCNLMCRTCNASGSNLIEAEYNMLGINSTTVNKEVDLSYIDIHHLAKLYIAGGEPLISDNVYNFLSKCCNNGYTQFELVINTNMASIPTRFKKLLPQFSNIYFMASIDAYDELNYYIRYPSKWSQIIKNLKYASTIGKISFNITISIYNIGYLYPLYKFLDTNYRLSEVHCQIAGAGDNTYSVYNHPLSYEIIDDLVKCNSLSICKNNAMIMSLHNSLIDYFSTRDELPSLELFFEFNNKLDANRKISLNDYNKLLQI